MSEAITLLVHPDPEIRKRIKKTIARTGFLNVWEGSVRSGKTVVALVAFVCYLRSNRERSFLMSGRTVGTIERNCIVGEYGILNLIPGSVYHKVGESRAVTFDLDMDGDIIHKEIVVLGAADIRAYMALRGQTYSGWFADEINMHDERFVEEAFNRTIKSGDRKHFFSLNPDNPNAWIYTKYLDRFRDMSPDEKKRLGGYYWHHFTPHDNPSLTPQMIDAMELQYPKGSYLYRRYILGERTIAEGQVYPMFGDSCIAKPPETAMVRWASIDFGTVHPTAMGWYAYDKPTRTYYKVREWRATPEQSAAMTTAEYMDVFERITEELGGINRMNLTIDYGGGGEALVREAERRHWMPQTPDKAVLDGISATARVLNTHTLFISPDCPKTIEELYLYHWDEKASERGEDKVVKIDDDLADETRYAVSTFIEPRIRR